MREFWISIFKSTEGSLSSKRVSGVFGWLVIHIVWIVVAIAKEQMPEFTDVLIFADASLLGLDSITGIWKNKKEE